MAAFTLFYSRALRLSNEYAKETLMDLTKSGNFWLNELCLVTENIWESMQSVYFFSENLKSPFFWEI